MLESLFIVAVNLLLVGPGAPPPAQDQPIGIAQPVPGMAQPPRPEPRPDTPKPDQSPQLPPGARGGRGPIAPVPPGSPAEPRPGTPGPMPVPERPFSTMKMFSLRFADAQDVARTLQNLLPETAAIPDPRTNSLIVGGSDESIERAAHVIADLDREAPQDRGMSVVTVPIQHRAAEELAKQIQMILGGRSHDLRLAADAGRSMLLLNGPQGDILTAVDVIRQLDTPAPTVNLEFAFFQARAADQGAKGEIPEDLAEVAKELMRFGGLELLGRFSTAATEGEEFTLKGCVASNLEAAVDGRLMNAMPGGAVKIRLHARLVLNDQVAAEGRPQPNFDLGTAVVANRGDYVVIGSAPAGWAPGESAILVLHVRP